MVRAQQILVGGLAWTLKALFLELLEHQKLTAKARVEE